MNAHIFNSMIMLSSQWNFFDSRTQKNTRKLFELVYSRWIFLVLRVSCVLNIVLLLIIIICLFCLVIFFSTLWPSSFFFFLLFSLRIFAFRGISSLAFSQSISFGWSTMIMWNFVFISCLLSLILMLCDIIANWIPSRGPFQPLRVNFWLGCHRTTIIYHPPWFQRRRICRCGYEFGGNAWKQLISSG